MDKDKYIDLTPEDNYSLFASDFTHMLIRQEVKMFLLIGNPVTQEEIEFISKRRGFNKEEKNFLITVLKMNPIGKDLTLDTAEEIT